MNGASWLLDAGTVGWLVVLLALLVLAEFDSAPARRARRVLVPLAVVLAAAFVWKVASVFGPMLVAGS